MKKNFNMLLRRIAAHIIDSICSFLPVLICIIYICSKYTPGGLSKADFKMDSDNYFFTYYSGNAYYAPLLYTAPVIGTASIIKLPVETAIATEVTVNENNHTTVEKNVSTGAVFMILFSGFSLLMYIFYFTICEFLLGGKTFGKYVAGLYTEYKSPKIKYIFLRNFVGKVLLNSTIIVPIISVFTLLFTKKHQAIHDMLGASVVKAK